MDDESRAARELLEILRLAGAEWAGRPWRTCAVGSSSEESGLVVAQPGFCYFWEAGDSPVEVAFASSGSVPSRKSRTMLVEVGRGLIRVSIPGRQPLVFSGLDAVASDRVSELIPIEAQAPREDAPSWQGELGLLSAAMRLIVLAGRAALDILDAGSGSSDDASITEALHDWLGRNPGGPGKLTDAAEHFGRNPRQLARLLRRTTGASFTDHVNLHRLVLARSLLMGTDRPVVEVAHECGFASREPFIRAFSKAFGWTPLQFRKAWMQAFLSGTENLELFQVADRDQVRWLAMGERENPSQTSAESIPTTLVVGNALSEIVELSRVTAHGLHLRHEVLDRGRMAVIGQTHGGSLWHVHAMESKRSSYFVTPDSHAVAAICSDTLGPK